jgi:hypothetical protein
MKERDYSEDVGVDVRKIYLREVSWQVVMDSSGLG